MERIDYGVISTCGPYKNLNFKEERKT